MYSVKEEEREKKKPTWAPPRAQTGAKSRKNHEEKATKKSDQNSQPTNHPITQGKQTATQAKHQQTGASFPRIPLFTRKRDTNPNQQTARTKEHS